MPTLKGVIRMDSLPVARTYFTEEGYLVDRPILTSTGIFEYRNEDGSIRRELRLPEEVFDRESLESYRLKPIIITHDAGLVTKDNVQDYQVGTIVSNGYKSGDDVRAEIVIHDTNAMKKAGLKELSLGYNLDLDETPGVWEGQPYDAIQRNIRINHLALVREARAGDQARLNIDSRDRQTLKGGKATMRAKKRKTSHNDSVLSPEELTKAIEEYKARRSGGATDAAEVVPPAAPAAPVAAPAPAVAPAQKNPQLAAIQDRNRDADEDMKLLFDIIDTLLADKAFDAAMSEQKCAMDAADQEADPAEAEAPVTDDDDTALPPEFLANQKKGKKAAKKAPKKAPAPEIVEDEDDEEPEDEDAEITTDADDTEDEEDDTFSTDADDEEPVDDTEDEDLTEDEDDVEDEELTEDEDDTDEEIMAEDDASSIGYSNEDPVPEANRKPAVINTDAIDSIVRQRVAVLRVADKLNLDGVDEMPLKEAKKAIIKAVTPSLRLDGKSNVYIDALYDRAVAEVNARNRKDTQYQVRQMYNKKSRSRSTRADADDSSAEARRQAMLERRLKKEER